VENHQNETMAMAMAMVGVEVSRVVVVALVGTLINWRFYGFYWV
jgi:hypothetical protein